MRLKASRIILVFVLCWIAASLLIVLRLDDRIPIHYHVGPKEFVHEDIATRVPHMDRPERSHDNIYKTKKPSIVFQDLPKDKLQSPQKKRSSFKEKRVDAAINDKQFNMKADIVGDVHGVDKAQIPGEVDIKDGMKGKGVEDKPLEYIPQLPEAIYDIQPPGAPGEGGRGVDINQTALTPEEKKRFDTMDQLHAFNEYASIFISVRRNLHDTRNPSCPRTHSQDLPSTSVIICFHNEAWTVLLRTVHSVLDRSPPYLVKEVLLVDDYSNMDHLKEPLQYYMGKLGKVRILRTKQREGLIRARLLGVDNATAPTLTFLDSHIECFPGWLEPLLTRIKDDRHRIVAPIINMINSRNFQVGGGDSLAVGIFKLPDLMFNWMQLPERDKMARKSAADPLRTPTIAGGLFSIDRDYFIEMGKYDEGMEIWGYENVEISLRTWMCGGSLEIHPCSHVAHIFRSRSPYNWGRPIGDILHRNAVRLAEVWLDDYKRFYYERIAYNLGDYGNVTDRIELRKRLKCKSFQWYIDNVYPDIVIPPTSLFIGEIMTPDLNQLSRRRQCLDSMSSNGNGNFVAIAPCHHMGGNQMWHYTDSGDIRIQTGCLTYNERKVKITFLHCMTDNATQKWTKHSNGTIVHNKTNMCLQRNIDNTMILATCGTSASQLWEFKPLKGDV